MKIFFAEQKAGLNFEKQSTFNLTMIKIANSRTVLLKTAAGGWITGLCLISLFVFTVKYPDPQWGSYWQIRPLLMTPLIAGMGAVFACFLFKRGSESGLPKILFTVLAMGSFLVSLWIGIILGLDGTLWD